MTYDGLTPEDVAAKRFTPVRGGREGYDMKEVDTYLDEVERSFLLLNDAHTALAGELSRSEIRLTDATNRMRAVDEELSQVRAARDADVAAAEAERDRAVAEANAQLENAQQLVAGAGIEVIEVRTVAETSTAAARLLQHASATAEATVAEAEETSKKLIDEANELAENRKRQAEENFLAVEKELNETRKEMLGEIEAERGRLTDEVAALKEFESTFRSDLTSYLGQLQDRVSEPLGTSEPQTVSQNEKVEETVVADEAPLDSSLVEEEVIEEAPVVDEPADEVELLEDPVEEIAEVNEQQELSLEDEIPAYVPNEAHDGLVYDASPPFHEETVGEKK